MDHTLKVLAFVALGLHPIIAGAAPVTFNLRVPLHESQIYECGGGAYPDGTKCWTNNRDDLLRQVRRRTIDPTDTIIVRLRFLRGERLRWQTDGIFSVSGVDEQVQVTLWDDLEHFGYNNGTWGNSLSFHGVRGDLNVNTFEWNVTGSSGGLVSQTQHSGITNLTDSFFDFSGITARIGPFSGGTGLPHEVDRLAIHFTSGRFSIVRPSHHVPEPSALALLGVGWVALLGVRRRHYDSWSKSTSS